MRTTLPTIAGAVTLSAALAASAFAQAPTPYPGGANEPQTRPAIGQGDAEHKADASGPDADFLTKAASDGQAEIELADLALKQSQSSDVKAFATTIKSDHMKAAAELKRLAGTKHVTVPSKPTAGQEAVKGRLSKLTGPAFDRAYADEMVSAHQKAVDLFTTASRSSDAEVKAFASQTLPVLKQHLQHAQQLH